MKAKRLLSADSAQRSDAIHKWLPKGQCYLSRQVAARKARRHSRLHSDTRPIQWHEFLAGRNLKLPQMSRLAALLFSPLLCICQSAFSQQADPGQATQPGGYWVPGFLPPGVGGPSYLSPLPAQTSPWNRFAGIFDHLYLPNSKTQSTRPNNNKNGCHDTGADPVIFSTGTKVEHTVDFDVPVEMGLRFERFYNATGLLSNTNFAWTTGFDYQLTAFWCGTLTCGTLMMIRPDGSSLQFQNVPKTSQTGLTNLPEVGGAGLATLVRNEADTSYILHDEDGSTQIYGSATGASGKAILSITDAAGIGWTFSYAGGYLGRVARVTHTNGQAVTFAYSPIIVGGVTKGYQMTVTDPAGNPYVYVLDSQQRYTQATMPGSPATVYGYQYNSQGYLSEIDINGAPYAYTTYDASGRVTSTYLAGGSQQYSIVYGSNATGPTTVITNPLGHTTTNQYNSQLQLIGVSGTAVSTCGATANARSYDSNGNLAGTIDNNTNIHTYNYAANGQLQTETEAYGTSLARTTDYVWDPNLSLNRPLSVTTRGGKRTTYTYNGQNRLATVAVTNLSGNGSANQTLTTAYNYSLYGNGMVQTMTVTRPSPNSSDTDTSTYDSLGRLTAFTNGFGQTTTYSNYNGLGQVGRVVGPNGDVIDYTYDARGRALTKTTYPNGTAATWTTTYDVYGLPYTLTEPDGKVTTWSRDARQWLSTITHNDKDGTSTESFSYDANGDVIQHTVTRGNSVGLSESFHYDAAGRVYQKIGQNGQTLTYAYDSNGNTLSVANAVGHTMTFQYDALNRVTQKSDSGGASPPIPVAVTSINLSVPGEVWEPTGTVSAPYTVSWASVPYASYYVLQEQTDNGDWITVQSGSAINWSTAGKPRGTYNYRVEACDSTGCSTWSPAGTFVVDGPNPELPAILQLIMGSS